MAAGIAALVKSIDPSILVIGVEPTGANKMAISLKTGKRVSLDKVITAVVSPVFILCLPAFLPCQNLYHFVVCLIGREECEPAQIDVFADGVAIKEPGAECFRLLRQFLDGILLVRALLHTVSLPAAVIRHYVCEVIAALRGFRCKAWLRRCQICPQGRHQARLCTHPNP